MTSYNKDGMVGPWAARKLEALEKYLSAYTTVLTSEAQSWCKAVYFIDAFAGAGRAQVRRTSNSSPSEDEVSLLLTQSQRSNSDEQDYINGSPRRALEANPPFTKYFFIELNSDRAKALQQLKTEYDGIRNIEICPGDASTELLRLINSIDMNWRSERAIVFLDPFGMQVKWSTICAIAETKAMEIYLNFPVGTTIQRLLPRSGRISPERRAILTEYFGTSEWEEVVYEEVPDLFEDTTTAKVERSGRKLAKWYQRRLKAKFGHVAGPQLVTNTKGGHLYYLIFAGPHPLGAKIFRHIHEKANRPD